MKRLLLILIFLLFTVNAQASDVERFFVYATNSQVTSTNLNGNFNNLVTVINGNLDNNNANTSGGYRFYEVLGSNPSAGTQGRMVYNTSNDILYADSGSLLAIVGSKQASSIEFEGDTANAFETTLTVTDPTADRIITIPNETGTILTTATDRFEVGQFTRDFTTATGTQAVTGVGFEPKAIYFMASIGLATGHTSWGFTSGTAAADNLVLWDDYGTTADTYSITGTARCILILETATKFQIGTLSSFGSDGFTISWIKTGTTSAGTVTVQYMAFK